MFSPKSLSLAAYFAFAFWLLQLSTAGAAGSDLLSNECPVLTQVIVAPRDIPVGQSATVFASATDDGILTYVWSSSGGTFADASAKRTTFTCSAAGEQSITITVTDSDSCSAFSTSRVVCRD